MNMWSGGSSAEPLTARASACSRGRRRFLFSDCGINDPLCSVPSAPSNGVGGHSARLPLGGDNYYPRSRSSSHPGSPDRLLSDRSAMGRIPPNSRQGAHSTDCIIQHLGSQSNGLEPAGPVAYSEPGLPHCQGQEHESLAKSGDMKTALSKILLGGHGKLTYAGTHGSSGLGRYDSDHADWPVDLGEVRHSDLLCASEACAAAWQASPRTMQSSVQGHPRSPSCERVDLHQAPLPGGRVPCSLKKVSSARQLYGPERFFYDASTFTGVHRHGGPSTLDKDGVNKFSHLSEMTRPNLRAGGTYLSSAGDPLSKKSPSAFLAPLHSHWKAASWETDSLRRCSSSRQLCSPDHGVDEIPFFVGSQSSNADLNEQRGSCDLHEEAPQRSMHRGAYSPPRDGAWQAHTPAFMRSSSWRGPVADSRLVADQPCDWRDPGWLGSAPSTSGAMWQAGPAALHGPLQREGNTEPQVAGLQRQTISEGQWS